MELIASVEAGDMKYAVAERQADDTQPFLGLEEACMSQLANRDFPATVSLIFLNKRIWISVEDCMVTL